MKNLLVTISIAIILSLAGLFIILALENKPVIGRLWVLSVTIIAQIILFIIFMGRTQDPEIIETYIKATNDYAESAKKAEIFLECLKIEALKAQGINQEDLDKRYEEKLRKYNLEP